MFFGLFCHAGKSYFLQAFTVLSLLHVASQAFGDDLSNPEHSNVANSQDIAGFQDVASENVNIVIAGDSLRPDPQDILWARDIVAVGSRYIRLYFDQIASSPDSEFRVEVYDQNSGARVARYSDSQFSERSRFLTGLLPGGSLQVRLIAHGPPLGLKFRLAAVIRETLDLSPIPKTSAPRWDPVRQLSEANPVRIAALAVAMVHIGTPPIMEACSGVLATRDLVVTSYHCLVGSTDFAAPLGGRDTACHHARPRGCSDVAVEFDFLDEDSIGRTAQCQEVVAYDSAAEFVALRIRPDDVSISGAPRPPARLGSVVADGTDRISIIYHPLGLPLEFDDSCRIRGTDQSDILHNCDSQSGSSGGPLFDSQMNWIGSHYRGPYNPGWSGTQIEEYLKLVAHGQAPPLYSHATKAATILQCAGD